MLCCVRLFLKSWWLCLCCFGLVRVCLLVFMCWVVN